MKIVGQSTCLPDPNDPRFILVDGGRTPKVSEKCLEKIRKAEEAKADIERRARYIRMG